jgi:hypothetical protein
MSSAHQYSTHPGSLLLSSVRPHPQPIDPVAHGRLDVVDHVAQLVDGAEPRLHLSIVPQAGRVRDGNPALPSPGRRKDEPSMPTPVSVAGYSHLAIAVDRHRGRP